MSKPVSILLIFFIFINIINCSNDDSFKSKIINKKILNENKSNLDTLICHLSFEEFFNKFKEDSLFQKQRIYKYAELLIIDNYEEKVFKKKLKKNFLNFNEDKNSNPIKFDVFKTNIIKQKDSVVYTKQGIDNGIYISFIFKKINGCWFLTKIIDESD